MHISRTAMSKPIGKILADARAAARISQAEAARQVGFMNVGSLWRIEHGQMKPSLESLLKLAELYGVDVLVGADRLTRAGYDA